MESVAKKARKAKKAKKEDEFQIVFKNDLAPEIWREYKEAVISVNLRDHVPAHMQEKLLDQFVEAGLMAP